MHKVDSDTNICGVLLFEIFCFVLLFGFCFCFPSSKIDFAEGVEFCRTKEGKDVVAYGPRDSGDCSYPQNSISPGVVDT